MLALDDAVLPNTRQFILRSCVSHPALPVSHDPQDPALVSAVLLTKGLGQSLTGFRLNSDTRLP